MKLHPKYRPQRQTRRTTLAHSATPAVAPEQFGFGRLWNPKVLDRLQMPLTRFRY